MTWQHTRECDLGNAVRLGAGELPLCICSGNLVREDKCPYCRRLPAHCACTTFYKALAVDCQVCQLTLEECAIRVGPAFVYTLYVHRVRAIETGHLLKKLGCLTESNPMAPYVNLLLHDHVSTTEWWLEANGKSWGSRGC